MNSASEEHFLLHFQTEPETYMFFLDKNMLHLSFVILPQLLSDFTNYHTLEATKNNVWAENSFS